MQYVNLSTSGHRLFCFVVWAALINATPIPDISSERPARETVNNLSAAPTNLDDAALTVPKTTPNSAPTPGLFGSDARAAEASNLKFTVTSSPNVLVARDVPLATPTASHDIPPTATLKLTQGSVMPIEASRLMARQIQSAASDRTSNSDPNSHVHGSQSDLSPLLSSDVNQTGSLPGIDQNLKGNNGLGILRNLNGISGVNGRSTLSASSKSPNSFNPGNDPLNGLSGPSSVNRADLAGIAQQIRQTLLELEVLSSRSLGEDSFNERVNKQSLALQLSNLESRIRQKGEGDGNGNGGGDIIGNLQNDNAAFLVASSAADVARSAAQIASAAALAFSNGQSNVNGMNGFAAMNGLNNVNGINGINNFNGINNPGLPVGSEQSRGELFNQNQVQGQAQGASADLRGDPGLLFNVIGDADPRVGGAIPTGDLTRMRPGEQAGVSLAQALSNPATAGTQAPVLLGNEAVNSLQSQSTASSTPNMANSPVANAVNELSAFTTNVPTIPPESLQLLSANGTPQLSASSIQAANLGSSNGAAPSAFANILASSPAPPSATVASPLSGNAAQAPLVQ